MRPPAEIVDALIAEGAVTVVRTPDAESVQWIASTLRDAGLNALEVTMTVPGATEQIRHLAGTLGPGHLVGVGSVRTPSQAEAAIAAGAAYVVSPVFDPNVVRVARDRGVPAMPGCLTPSEIHAAVQAGADVVKVFPAEAVGMGFLKAVLAPMPELRLMPTGGVTCENAGEWITHGAAMVGVGDSLVPAAAVTARDADALRGRAEVLLESIRSARAARTARRA